jgi:hypothetical protein
MIANALKKNSGINYPGLIAAWSAKGKTNDDEDRAILKDLTGNGHDITLNGFAFSEMSGYGGYNLNFKNCNTKDNEPVKLKNNSKIVLYNTDSYNSNIWKYINGSPAGTVVNIKSYKVKISGLSEGEYIVYDFNTGDDFKVANKINLYNGVNTIPEIYGTVITDKISYTTIFQYGTANVRNKELTIELLPEYPDALVFDGVDDYGSAVDFGGKSIEFIIAKYQHLSYSIGRCSLYGRLPNNDNWYRINLDRAIDENPYIRVVNTNYTSGTKIDDNASFLSVGDKAIYKTLPFQLTGFDGNKEVANIAFYSAYIFDRVLNEQEIKEFIRKYIDSEYLLPSEQTTE